MKKQIRRFSPFQNAKVLSVLMALAMLPFFIPFFLIPMFATPEKALPEDFPVVIFMAMPFFYMIMGFFSVCLGCWLYNNLYRFIGGLEIELEDLN